MSAKATFWAWEQEVEGAVQKLILLCLADCHNADTNSCWPSIGYISKKTGANDKTITKHLRRLQDQKLVIAEHRTGASTVFYLNIGQLQTPPNFGTPPKNNPPQIRDHTPPKIGTTPPPKLGDEPKKNLKGNLSGKKSTRKRSLLEDLTDRSWSTT